MFANSVLDPAIGIGGELAIKTIATADWHNWISSMQIGSFEIATRIGVPPLQGTSLNYGLSLSASSSAAFGSCSQLPPDVRAALLGCGDRRVAPTHRTGRGVGRSERACDNRA